MWKKIRPLCLTNGRIESIWQLSVVLSLNKQRWHQQQFSFTAATIGEILKVSHQSHQYSCSAQNTEQHNIKCEWKTCVYKQINFCKLLARALTTSLWYHGAMLKAAFPYITYETVICYFLFFFTIHCYGLKFNRIWVQNGRYRRAISNIYQMSDHSWYFSLDCLWYFSLLMHCSHWILQHTKQK